MIFILSRVEIAWQRYDYRLSEHILYITSGGILKYIKDRMSGMLIYQKSPHHYLGEGI